jgi:hypothetical protein
MQRKIFIATPLFEPQYLPYARENGVILLIAG